MRVTHLVFEYIKKKTLMWVKASSVAALIGLNPFNSEYEAFAEMWRLNGCGKFDINQETVSELISRTPELKRLETELRTRVNEDPQAVESIVQEVGQKRPYPQDDAINDMIVQKMKKEVLCQYGKTAEAVVVKNDNITDSNKKMYEKHIGGNIKICGYPDGFRDGKLVEIKNRKNKIGKTIYTTDKIQVHCYMYLCDVKECELIERTPDGSERCTTVLWNETLWDTIQSALQKVYENFQQLKCNEGLRQKVIECKSFDGIQQK